MSPHPKPAGVAADRPEAVRGGLPWQWRLGVALVALALVAMPVVSFVAPDDTASFEESVAVGALICGPVLLAGVGLWWWARRAGRAHRAAADAGPGDRDSRRALRLGIATIVAPWAGIGVAGVFFPSVWGWAAAAAAVVALPVAAVVLARRARGVAAPGGAARQRATTALWVTLLPGVLSILMAALLILLIAALSGLE